MATHKLDLDDFCRLLNVTDLRGERVHILMQAWTDGDERTKGQIEGTLKACYEGRRWLGLKGRHAIADALLGIDAEELE